MKQYFLYTILILSIAKLSAQYEFENISVENGLSQSTVYDILKDKKGFIWFCTDYGLDRFIGISFQKVAK